MHHCSHFLRYRLITTHYDDDDNDGVDDDECQHNDIPLTKCVPARDMLEKSK